MLEGFNPVRYSVIQEKNPREIVMLVGDGNQRADRGNDDYGY